MSWHRGALKPSLRDAVAQPSLQSAGRGDAYPAKYLRSTSPALSTTMRPALKRAGIVAIPLLPVLVFLTISITFYQDDNGTSFNPELALHLAGYSLATLVTLGALAKRKLRADSWMFAWCLVPLCIAATTFYAPEPLLSLTAGLAHLALLLFAWRMVTRYGQIHSVLAIMIAGTVIGALSIFAYYTYPSFGASISDPLLGDMGGRMRGVTSQPNSLGLISAFAVLLAVVHFKVLSPRQRIFSIFAIGISAFCLVYSDSRTAIAALVICIGLWWLCRANAALNLFSIVGIALASSLVIAFVPDVSAYLTREGTRSDDLTSLNGRSYIWQVAWENIRAHPVFGQGYGSSHLILPRDERLFAAAVNTHNLYLELLFSGGIVLLGLFVIGVTGAIVRSVKERRVEALILLLFFLIVGGGASAAFGSLPLFPSAALYTAVALCLVRSRASAPVRALRVQSAMVREGQVLSGTQFTVLRPKL